ncbi:cell wall-binding repeat-containing protein [Ornithinimicrobium avium]|uniref:cell wall-binding repeat-containing protein n=1 Tax=Ornithinimicrobium avium TaxID=2283195 RepID=UPI0013B3B35B|nr:cell wall-binding repeat-containing protein [Ornithinimicrobium avium]
MAACIVVGLVPSVVHADVTPVTRSGWSQWSGEDRYATGVAVSEATFTGTVPHVFVASGVNFPDALAAGPVAGLAQGPILLTRPGSLPSVVAAELARLRPETVTVVGGPTAVSVETVAAIRAASGAQVVRVGGANRYGTAAAVAAQVESLDTVYLASGQAFPDALAAGPAAGRRGAAVLLSRPGSLPEETRAFLVERQPSRVVLVGGTAALSADVRDAVVRALPGAQVVRLAGTDRYDTARRVALEAWPGGTRTVFYAPGTNFPDALSASPAAVVNDAPLLLTREGCQPYEAAVGSDFLSPTSKVAVGGKTYTGSTVCGPKPSYPFPADLDCVDFASQRKAQDWYDYWYPKVGDIYRLDGDKDGKVCEVWPPR